MSEGVIKNMIEMGRRNVLVYDAVQGKTDITPLVKEESFIFYNDVGNLIATHLRHAQHKLEQSQAPETADSSPTNEQMTPNEPLTSLDLTVLERARDLASQLLEFFTPLQANFPDQFSLTSELYEILNTFLLPLLENQEEITDPEIKAYERIIQERNARMGTTPAPSTEAVEIHKPVAPLPEKKPEPVKPKTTKKQQTLIEDRKQSDNKNNEFLSKLFGVKSKEGGM
jgi:hypothetical protein